MASPTTDIDLEILTSNDEPKYHSLSVSCGNSHVVIKLAGITILSEVMNMLSAYKPPVAQWLILGSFGNCPATLYCSKRGFSIIVDGDSCGDGSRQSFGINFPLEEIGSFIRCLKAEVDAVANVAFGGQL